MEAKQVLIIDNDPALQQLLESMLAASGFRIYNAFDGEQGLREFSQQHVDLVLLDIMMPQMSGWEVLRQLRRRSDIPIIIISALFREEYSAYATQYGADFLMKPFSRTDLLRAIEAVLPWTTKPTDKEKIKQANYKQLASVELQTKELGVVHGTPQSEHTGDRPSNPHLQIDLATRRVLVQDKRIKLTGTEYRLLEYLFNHANQVLTYQQILDAVWGWEYRNSTHYVHVFVSQLRQKLEANPEEPRYLLTERGGGYFFALKK